MKKVIDAAGDEPKKVGGHYDLKANKPVPIRKNITPKQYSYSKRVERVFAIPRSCKHEDKIEDNPTRRSHSPIRHPKRNAQKTITPCKFLHGTLHQEFIQMLNTEQEDAFPNNRNQKSTDSQTQDSLSETKREHVQSLFKWHSN